MNTVDGLHELSSEHVAAQARSPLGSRRRTVSIRMLVWLLHMATPLLVLWLVVARSQFDVRWEHHSAHFWLVTVVAVINVGLGNRIAAEARRRADARLLCLAGVPVQRGLPRPSRAGDAERHTPRPQQIGRAHV